MKTPTRKKASFNPNLSIISATTWWALGRWTGERNKPASMRAWLAAARNDALASQQKYITIPALADFAANALDVLQRKFNGEPVRKIVEKLTCGRDDIELREDGRYLNTVESERAFWALEYDGLFSELRKPEEGEVDNWLNAATTCRECGLFFIKSRIDQTFHDSKCRVTYLNRDAYSRKRGARKGVRGKTGGNE